MVPPRPRRSALFLPASNARAIEKARGLACDMVILDLEDAVAPEAKEAARDAAVAAVDANSDGAIFGPRELLVRVNALDGEWGPSDCLALRGKRVPIVVPKVDDAAAVLRYAALLDGSPLWAMVETARAALRPDELASARGLAGLVMGTNDLAKELRAAPGLERAPLLGFLAATVAAARAQGLSVLDGVCNAIDDPDRLAAECAQGRAFGFDGKSLIHPAQIAVANAAFGPSANEVAAARAVVAAFDDPANADRGAIRLDGRMVERLHLDEARRTLALAAAISTGEAG